jgi:hypothetical protein
VTIGTAGQVFINKLLATKTDVYQIAAITNAIKQNSLQKHFFTYM